MKNIIIFEILNDMAEELTVFQLKKLQEVLLKRFDEEEKQPNPAKNEYRSVKEISHRLSENQ